MLTFEFLQENDIEMETPSLVPVQTLLNGYIKDDDGKMEKLFSQEINYFNFRELFTDDIYYDTFDVSNCFPRDEERVHLDLFLKTGSGESFTLELVRVLKLLV